MLGARLDGRYRLETELRRDADGVVYAGQDERLNRPVAVTVLAPHRAADPAYLAVCRERTGRLASITHPHLVPVYDSSLEGETPFIVTPLVEAAACDAGCRRAAAARRVRAARGGPVCLRVGLAPRSRYRPRRAGSRQLVLADDGDLFLIDLARPPVAEAPLRAPYEAPELALGQAPDARSDVFALAAVLYEAIVGEAPFGGADRASIALAKLNQAPLAPAVLAPGVPTDLSDAVMLGLSAGAAQRPADGARFALRLETVQAVGLEATQAMAPTQVLATPPAAPPPLAAWEPDPVVAAPESAGGFLPWLGLFAVLAVISGLWLALRNPKLPEAPPLPVDQAVVPR